jgi:predicted kinase
LLDLAPVVVAIPGARRPETARSAARAAELALGADDRRRLARALGGFRPVADARPRSSDGEVVVVMGIPGAGKSRIADELATRGYVRLNRDQRGGSLRELADALDQQLASGAERIVLDNTHLTRASRSYVIDAARRRGVAARCVWIDTPLAQAQVNLVERLLDRFGSLPTPEDLRGLARREQGVLVPTSQMRALRELEEPSVDEGFAEVEQVPFVRSSSGRGRTGVLVAAAALKQPGWERATEEGDRNAPHLVFDWSPGGAVDQLDTLAASLAREVSGSVESSLCAHPAGPPTCWCRPPLPGLALAFARAHDVDPARSILVGTSPAHRTLATTLGARYIQV